MSRHSPRLGSDGWPSPESARPLGFRHNRELIPTDALSDSRTSCDLAALTDSTRGADHHPRCSMAWNPFVRTRGAAGHPRPGRPFPHSGGASNLPQNGRRHLERPMPGTTVRSTNSATTTHGTGLASPLLRQSSSSGQAHNDHILRHVITTSCESSAAASPDAGTHALKAEV